MRKNYIIKDVRKTLAQQINNIDTSERTSMENTHFHQQGYLQLFRRTMTVIVLSIKWIVRMALDL